MTMRSPAFFLLCTALVGGTGVLRAQAPAKVEIGGVPLEQIATITMGKGPSGQNASHGRMYS